MYDYSMDSFEGMDHQSFETMDSNNYENQQGGSSYTGGSENNSQTGY